MWLGSLRLDLVPGGRARLDGKTLFGVVPERLWERRFPADASGRVTVASNLLLIRSPDLTVLVQAGPGGSSLAPALAQHGVAAEEVTALVLSNLHVDHAGGAAYRVAAHDSKIPANIDRPRRLVLSLCSQHSRRDQTNHQTIRTTQARYNHRTTFPWFSMSVTNKLAATLWASSQSGKLLRT